MQTEHHTHREIETASDRSFGLTVGAILGAIEAYRYYTDHQLDLAAYILIGIAAPLLALGAFYPPVLAPLNKLWTKLGELLFCIVNPVIMLFVYVTTIVPIGLLLRLWGKDPLRLKRDAAAKSYWILRDGEGPSPESMKNQF